NLIVDTTAGGVWEIDVNGHAIKLGRTGTFLEGVTTVPNDPVRYGPLAGKVLALNEDDTGIFTVDLAGNVTSINLGVSGLETAHVIPANENFFGVDFGESRLLGATAAGFSTMVGDILLTQEGSGAIFRLAWDGQAFLLQPLDLASGSIGALSWEGSN